LSLSGRSWFSTHAGVSCLGNVVDIEFLPVDGLSSLGLDDFRAYDQLFLDH